jgi:XRE family transcriptional regulator, regulator of sulfur utilization
VSFSRRDLAALLPALCAEAQDPSSAGTQEPELHSAAYEYASLPERTSSNGKMKGRSVFRGVTTRGQRLTMHISELAPGQAPHPPERQPHDEVIVIREGTLEATLNGKVVRLGPGSVIFSAYKELNGWRNVGTTPAQYYVLSLEEHS